MQRGGHFPLCGLAGSHLDTRAKTCGVSPLRLIHRDYQIGRSSSLTHSYHTTTPEIPSPSPLCRGQWNKKHNCSHSAEVLPEGTVSRRQWKMQGIHTIGTPPHVGLLKRPPGWKSGKRGSFVVTCSKAHAPWTHVGHTGKARRRSCPIICLSTSIKLDWFFSSVSCLGALRSCRPSLNYKACTLFTALHTFPHLRRVDGAGEPS